MGDREASVRLGLEGSDDVIRGFESVGSASTSAGGKIREGLGNAAREVGGHVSGLIRDGIRLATVMGGISIGKLVEDSKRSELAIQRLSIGAGRAFGDLKSQVRGLSLDALLDPAAAEGLVKGYGKATYAIGDAAKRLKALNAEAVASGRDVGDELPLGQALAEVGIKAEETEAVLGRVTAQAEKLGTTGGPAALRDAVAAAAGQIQALGQQSAESLGKVTALIGTLGKGYSPGQQKQIGAGVLGALESRYIDIERSVGFSTRNKDGTFNAEKQAKALQAFRDRAVRHLGRDRAELALGNFFGSSITGSAVLNADYAGLGALGGAAPSGKAAAAQAALGASGAGKGARQDIANQQAGQDAVEPIVGAQRGYASLFANNPVLGLLAGGLAGSAASAGLGALGKGALGLLGLGGKAAAGAAAGSAAAGAGLAAGGAAAAGETALTLGEAQAALAAAEAFGKTSLTAGAAGATALGVGAGAGVLGLAGLALSQTGKDSYTGRRAQARQRTTTATELAGQVSRGELGSDFYGQVVPSLVKKSGGDEATLREVLQILSKQALPASLAKDIGTAVAEALKANPPQIQVAGPSATDQSVAGAKADGAGSTG